MDSERAELQGSQQKAKLSGHDRSILDRIFNPTLPGVETEGPEVESDENVDVEEENEVITEAKRLEVEGVKAAEKGMIQESLDYFNRAITVAPERPSGYNNRAQALRILRDERGALDDLNKAIELSEGHGRSARQAFTQRGLIRKLEGQNELAVEDFQKAANLGCAFAKDQVIAMNPYAALCNSMMSEMISKVKAGEEV